MRMLRQVRRAREAVRRASLASRDRLRIGTTTYGPPDQVLRGMSRLRKATSAEGELGAGEAHDLLKDLRDGEIDAAVVHTPVPATGLSLVWMASSPVVAVVPAGDRCAGPRISGSCSARRMLLLPRRHDPGFHDAAIAGLRQNQMHPEQIDESPTSVDQL